MTARAGAVATVPGSRASRVMLGAAAVTMLVVAACGSPAPSGPAQATAPVAGSATPGGSPEPGGSTAPGWSGSLAPTTDLGGSGGPGSASAIAAPAGGLDTLPAYRATLAFSFSGTQGGKPTDWTQTYTLTADRAAGVRVLEYGQTGLGDGPAPRPALEGTDGSAIYLVADKGSACLADMAGADTPKLAEPAAMLPVIVAMTPGGSAAPTGGIQAVSWTFSRDSLALKGEPTVQGGATVATSGGLVLSYDLSIAGGHDVFDADTEGTYHWAYELEPLSAGSTSALPATCPRPLADLPIMPAATNVARLPGSTSYSVTGSVDAVTAFYAQAMPAAGYTADGSPWVGATGATMTWQKDGRRLAVTVRAVIPIEVEISEVAGAGAANPTPVPQPTTSGQAAMTRVAQSMTTLIGVDQVPSVLGSYHVVYHGDAPVWIDGKVARDVIDVTGDVAGADVHFVYKEKRGSAKATRVEGYHVADVDRAVEGGKLQDDYGMAYISWVSWPLDLVVAVAVGGFRSEAAGTAPVDGRTAEVYRLSGKASDDPSGMIASMGLPIQAASGTVWVDQATGALLKATMSYTAQVKDIDGVHGTAEGSLTLEVSKAGQVTVKMP